MLLKWLEPVIEAKCSEINDEVLNNEEKEHYDNLIAIIKRNNFVSQDDALDIENTFLLSVRSAVQFAYKEGLRDGINIYRK